MEEEQKISSDQVALAFAKAYYYQLHEGADSMSRFYTKDAVSTYGYLEKPIYTDEVFEFLFSTSNKKNDTHVGCVLHISC
jgi:hypothetical protein